jgi:hypothetical protein
LLRDTQVISTAPPLLALPKGAVGSTIKFLQICLGLVHWIAYAEALALSQTWREFGRNIWHVGVPFSTPNHNLPTDSHAVEFEAKDAAATLKTMVSNPYVNHIPTITGGIGAKDLLRFYRDFFIPSNPSSMTTKLLSRTIGSDRIVDEMLISFTHTCEIPWMLPGVPATNRKVEIVLVSVVCIRGGKLYHEHLYWDQASVLVQVGLLDPKLGAVGLGKNGVNALPIAGVETARKVLDESSVESNKMITDW